MISYVLDIDSYVGLMHTLFTLEDYDKWRYHYPEFDRTQKIAGVISQELSDLLAETLNESKK